MGRIHLGTSGYVYKHWKHIFYPDKLPARRWLEYFVQVFSTCELNNSFYMLPKPACVDGWRERTPPGFVFAAKGSRFLTHMKQLNDVDWGLHRYFDVMFRLENKLHVVLWQLPPHMKKPNLEKLEMFLAFLPPNVRHVIEFRSENWYRDDVCDLLDAYGVAFCEHDIVRGPDGQGLRPPRLTGGFRYIRFHGATGKYQGRYGLAGLAGWAADLRSYRGDAYVYFNNDLFGHALMDAMDLSELLDEPLPIPAELAARRARLGVTAAPAITREDSATY